MGIRFTQLQCKEVICVTDGRRLGFVTDVHIELPQGEICALQVPGPCRLFGLLGRSDDYLIPWQCVKRVGPDIILVDAKPEDCRMPRPKPGWLG